MAKKRNFPQHTLEEALTIAQKIQDEMAGRPFKRLLLAEALGIKPGSTNFRDLLSSSFKYGLTEGTEKASEIKITELGKDATQIKDSSKKIAARRKAARTPQLFETFFIAYTDRKIPSTDLFNKILISEYDVPKEYAVECVKIINENGRFVDIIREIGGSPHVLLDASYNPANEESSNDDSAIEQSESVEEKDQIEEEKEQSAAAESKDSNGVPRAIFIGHGKKKPPLEKLQKFLSSFQIPYKVVIDEANLGRPISQKVKETMLQCGSAILIFTCDEKFQDEKGDDVWRPSENVIYELGAASYAYEDRIVIFKEKGIHFPTNFQNLGYIEFEENGIEAKTTELLKELIGFGLVKITTA